MAQRKEFGDSHIRVRGESDWNRVSLFPTLTSMLKQIEVVYINRTEEMNFPVPSETMGTHTCAFSCVHVNCCFH